MSDDDLKDPVVSEADDELLDLLDRLSPATRPAQRGVVEILGALPYALEDLPARPEVKRELLTSLPGAAVAGAEATLSTASGRLGTLERRARWYMPIAAALAIALLGIAAFQFRRLEGQQRTIDQLSSQLRRVEQNGAELTEIRRLLAEKGRHLRMLTSRGAEFCLLKPVGDAPRYPAASATMVIAPDRRQWYLAAQGLEPCASEVCYQLWFLTDAESIHAASFDSRGGEERIELSGSHEGVPAGVRAISITRDSESGETRPPETVLLADQAMTLL